jgi:TP53 regulating kinase-like protein
MAKMKSPILIKKGAEASLYIDSWQDRKVIMKKRLPKGYRPTQLDDRIRIYRTAHEPQLMHDAKKAGVPTPMIFLVDMKNSTIIMEYVEGAQMKKLLNEVTKTERQSLCSRIGELIGKLHAHGVVHGDLTTSNMILDTDGKIRFVDFGLGEKTEELEALGVDLHLMKRALQSTHFRYAEECFKAVIEGYSKVQGEEIARKVLDKIKDIEKRGRYVSERRSENYD